MGSRLSSAGLDNPASYISILIRYPRISGVLNNNARPTPSKVTSHDTIWTHVLDSSLPIHDGRREEKFMAATINPSCFFRVAVPPDMRRDLYSRGRHNGSTFRPFGSCAGLDALLFQCFRHGCVVRAVKRAAWVGAYCVGCPLHSGQVRMLALCTHWRQPVQVLALDSGGCGTGGSVGDDMVGLVLRN